jgi:hypothetical protein
MCRKILIGKPSPGHTEWMDVMDGFIEPAFGMSASFFTCSLVLGKRRSDATASRRRRPKTQEANNGSPIFINLDVSTDHSEDRLEETQITAWGRWADPPYLTLPGREAIWFLIYLVHHIVDRDIEQCGH